MKGADSRYPNAGGQGSDRPWAIAGPAGPPARPPPRPAGPPDGLPLTADVDAETAAVIEAAKSIIDEHLE